MPSSPSDSWFERLVSVAMAEDMGLDDGVCGIPKSALLIVGYLLVLFRSWFVHRQSLYELHEAVYNACHVIPTLAAVEDVSATEKQDSLDIRTEKPEMDRLLLPKIEKVPLTNANADAIGNLQEDTGFPKTAWMSTTTSAFWEHGPLCRGYSWYLAWVWLGTLTSVVLSAAAFLDWLPSAESFPLFYILKQILYPLAVCQLYMYWRHSIIATSLSGQEYGSRNFAFDPARVVGAWTAFKATTVPLILYGVSYQLAVFGGSALSYQLSPDANNDRPECLGDVLPAEMDQLHWGDIWVFIAFFAVTYVLMVIPALVILIRVQASLLTDGEKTVVPFDRTFGVDKVWGRGYLTPWEAFRSVSLSSWRRIYWVFFESYSYTLFTVLIWAALVFWFTMVFWGVLLLLGTL